jgi:hypothetical protein
MGPVTGKHCQGFILENGAELSLDEARRVKKTTWHY